MKRRRVGHSKLVVRWTATVLALASINNRLAAGNSEIAAHQARLQIAEAPKDPQSVLAVQKELVAAKRRAAPTGPREFVVVGQIGGMPNVWPETHPDFPWYKGQASFFLVDTKVAAQFASHAKKHGENHNCSFCQSLARKNASAIAVVNLTDEQGKILRIDARELLGLEENTTVVVRGKAKLLSGRLLVIDADGIHLQQVD
ncbi:MAG TPA: hypothetical protein VHK01_19165 [Lacipirellulaceae bacterium]|nr:hypothetical protein [Lacipirellulaceae bacterium]